MENCSSKLGESDEKKITPNVSCILQCKFIRKGKWQNYYFWKTTHQNLEPDGKKNNAEHFLYPLHCTSVNLFGKENGKIITFRKLLIEV